LSSSQLAVIIRGSTVYLVAQVYQADGFTLQDVDTVAITVYDPTGTLIATVTSITHSGLGLYTANYTLPSNAAPGNWHADWTVSIGTVPDIARVYFEVVR
jgi:uncharacterized protein YfaS (alpha-2-macroglobulin family)